MGTQVKGMFDSIVKVEEGGMRFHHVSQNGRGIKIMNILCAFVLCLYVCLCEGARFPGTEDAYSPEPPCWCSELNPGPLEE